MCIPDSRHGLTLAWVTSENSTMLLESGILRLFFTGPYLVSSPLCSVSGVDCPSVDPRQLLCSPLSCPVSTAFSLLSSHQLLRGLQPQTAFSPVQPPTLSLLSSHQLSLSWVASSTLVRVPLPLPDTARFHVQESFVWFRAKADSSALAAYPHSATYLPLLPLSFILNKLQHDLTTSKKKTRTFTGSKNRNYKILKGFGRPLKKIINNITTPYHHTHKKKFF